MQKRRAKIPDSEHVIDSTINLWNEGSLLTLSQLVRRKSLDFAYALMALMQYRKQVRRAKIPFEVR